MFVFAFWTEFQFMWNIRAPFSHAHKPDAQIQRLHKTHTHLLGEERETKQKNRGTEWVIVVAATIYYTHTHTHAVCYNNFAAHVKPPCEGRARSRSNPTAYAFDTYETQTTKQQQ